MKKTIWLLGAFFLGGTLLATTLATPVVADTTTGPGDEKTNLSSYNTTVSTEQKVFTATDQPARAMSRAEFTVKAGQLTLVAVPDLNFGNVEAATIVKGGEKLLESNKVDKGSSKGNSAFDGNNDGKLIVSDMRGTGKGWSLSVSMDSVFDSGDSTVPKLNGLSLKLAAEGSNSFFDPKNQHLNLEGTATSNSQIVVSTDHNNNTGVGETTFNLNTSNSASLVFPPTTNSTFKADAAYQSNVTWTLQATQTT